MGLTYGNYIPVQSGQLVAGKYIRADRLSLMYQNYNRLLGNYGRIASECATMGGNPPAVNWWQDTEVFAALATWYDIWCVYQDWTYDFSTVTIQVRCQARVADCEVRAFVGATTTAAQALPVAGGWTILTFPGIARGNANPIAMGIQGLRTGAGGYISVAYVTVLFDAQTSPLAVGPQAHSGAYPSEIDHYAQAAPHSTWQHTQIYEGLQRLVQYRPTNWTYCDVLVSLASYRGAWRVTSATPVEQYRFRIRPKTSSVKIYALAVSNVNTATIYARSAVTGDLVSNTSAVIATPTRADWVLVGDLQVQQNQHDWLVISLSTQGASSALYGVCVREVWI